MDKKELLEQLELMAKSFDGLPQHALMQPITYYDHYSLLLLLLGFFRSICKEESCDNNL